MARINNAITFGAGFNIASQGPIDSRMRVEYENDLITAATWDNTEAPLYDGLTTTVMETGDIWVLMDKTKYTDKTTGEGWVNKSKGGSGSGTTYQAGQNIVIGASGDINAEGYVFGTTYGSFAETFRQDSEDGGQIVANTATGLGAHAEGYNTTASGDYGSHAEGYYTTAGGYASHAEGIQTNASGNYSNAEGRKTTASAEAAHSEGYKTNATARWAHAEGYGSTASGEVSHAEGYETIASNYYAHSEGTQTTASAPCSHAEGIRTIASGEGSHAEGWGHSNEKNNAIGNGSHAEGAITIAQNMCEHAEGYYNKSHKTVGDGTSFLYSSGNTIHSIGIGDINNNQRKNAVEVMQNGDVYINRIGDYDGIYIKGEQGATSSLKTLQEVIASLQAQNTNLKSQLAFIEPYTVPADEIWYTTDNNRFQSLRNQGRGLPTILSNTYKNGRGVFKFNQNVTSIGDLAFEHSIDITSIVIPNSVTSIGDGAFYECYDLKSVKIPNSVTSIGAYAFEDTWIQSIIIPPTVTSIGEDAFKTDSEVLDVTFESATPITMSELVDGVRKPIYIFGKFGEPEGSGSGAASGSGSGAASGSGSGAASGSGSGAASGSGAGGGGYQIQLTIRVPYKHINSYKNSTDPGWVYYRDYIVPDYDNFAG